MLFSKDVSKKSRRLADGSTTIFDVVDGGIDEGGGVLTTTTWETVEAEDGKRGGGGGGGARGSNTEGLFDDVAGGLRFNFSVWGSKEGEFFEFNAATFRVLMSGAVAAPLSTTAAARVADAFSRFSFSTICL